MEKAIIGLLGIFLGSLLTLASEYLSDKRSRNQNSTYIAIRVSCLLDRFINSCIPVVQDDGTCQGSYGPDDRAVAQAKTPNISFDEIDADWKSLPAQLTYKILNFPNDITDANEYIASVEEHVSSPPYYEEIFEARQFKYSELGLKAFKLSEKLHREFSLPSRVYEGWNPIEILEKTFKSHSKK